MFDRDPDGDVPRRRPRVELTQLQRDALAQVAGADAGGLEGLYGGEHTLHVRRGRFDLRQQAGPDLLQIVLQVAVIVDRIHDDTCDRQVDGGQLGELELLDQLFLQRLTVLVAEVAAAVVVARPR